MNKSGKKKNVWIGYFTPEILKRIKLYPSLYFGFTKKRLFRDGYETKIRITVEEL